MSKYVAAYDVSDDSQRTKIADLLMQYGYRIQRSVFVIELIPQDIPALRVELGSLLAASDEFDLLPVDLALNRPHLRWQANLDDLESVVIVE